MHRLFVPAALLVVALCAVRAEARRSPFVSQGQAVIAGGNCALARSQSIQVALRPALAQALATLGGPSEGEDVGVDKTSYARAAAFVPASTVVNEAVDGNVLEVELNVEVDLEALRIALGGRKGAPKG